MIIIWVDLEDLKPNPREDLEWAEQAFGKEALDKWEKSMREEGFKKEKLLLVDWRGTIADGNVRYYLAKKIGIKYLPIDFNFLVRDLNSFIHTQAYRWVDRMKLTSEELLKVDARMLELLPLMKKMDEKEKAEVLKQLIEQIITKRISEKDRK